MTIWIAHQPRSNKKEIDLTPLYEFAKEVNQDVRIIFSSGFNLSQNANEAMSVAENFAAKFDWDRDMVVLTGGDPMAGVFIGLALAHEAAEVGAKSFGALRYVREYDATGTRTISRYLPFHMPTGIE